MEDRHTVSVKREKMAEDYAALRRRYEDHRQTIVRLSAEAPTERLAMRYEDAKRELDAAIIKVEELEQGSQPPPRLPPAYPENKPTAPGTYPSRNTLNSPLEKSLRMTQSDVGATPVPPESPRESSDRSRTLLIIGAGLLALGLLGFFVWKFALGRDPDSGASKQVAVTETVAVGETSGTEPAADTANAGSTAITITPASQDFGRIQKGARAARQFEIVNSTGAPLGLSLARSKCRCLWFEYPDKIEAGRSTLTVTLDASKANKGELNETIKVTSASNPAVAGSITVTASIE